MKRIWKKEKLSQGSCWRHHHQGTHCWPVYAPCRAVNRHSTPLCVLVSPPSSPPLPIPDYCYRIIMYTFIFTRVVQERGPGTFPSSLLISHSLFIFFSLLTRQQCLAISFTHTLFFIPFAGPVRRDPLICLHQSGVVSERGPQRVPSDCWWEKKICKKEENHLSNSWYSTGFVCAVLSTRGLNK